MDMFQVVLMVFTSHFRRVRFSLDITTFGSKLLENLGIWSRFCYISYWVNVLKRRAFVKYWLNKYKNKYPVQYYRSELTPRARRSYYIERDPWIALERGVPDYAI